MRICCALASSVLFATVSFGAAASQPAEPRVLDVGKAWAGQPVGFCLLTKGDRQYVAYYDDARRMTVASRRLNEDRWQYVHLPSTLGWDSHNYVTMTMDDRGFLHVSGNMHCVPLVYFRSEKPYDAGTLQQIPQMVGREEQHVTYPQFLRGAKGELLFMYRDGGSGRGNQIYNVYDSQTQSWQRLMDKPLLDGKGQMSAYLDGIRRDRSGMFHLCWCWRETYDCSTNRDICYARSRDLVHWEKSDGTPLTLPITHGTGEIVDPVPPRGGTINGNVRLGFDAQDRPVISYLKYDAQGRSQAYNARLRDGRWQIQQVSQWDYRWEFSGGGSIPFEIGIGPVERDAKGQLSQTFNHPKAGSGRWELDPETLVATGTVPSKPRDLPADLFQSDIRQPDMQVRWAGDTGSPPAGVSYRLRWETLGPNRDHPREGTPPPPSQLRLIELR